MRDRGEMWFLAPALGMVVFWFGLMFGAILTEDIAARRPPAVIIVTATPPADAGGQP